MKLQSVYGYLITPGEKSENIRGTSIDLRGNFAQVLYDMFDKSVKECKHDIKFLPEKKQQENLCRTLFMNYIKSPALSEGLRIAERLNSVVDKRNGIGLLFLLLGSHGSKTRLVVSRFPADFGILARSNESGLDVSLVEEVFLKNAKSYKSAVYEDSITKTGFWKGRAIDKQINSRSDISEYWITDFLASDFSTSGLRGTRRIAIAMKEAVNKSDDVSIKDEITAAAKFLPNQLDKKVISAAKILTSCGLSPDSQTEVKNYLHESILAEKFRFLGPVFRDNLAFKSVRLDNGAIMSATTENFERVFQSTSNPGAKTLTWTTTGKVVDEKLRKKISV